MSVRSITWELESFVFESSTGWLHHSTLESRQLPPQASILLRTLIEADGELVTRDHLYETLWGDQFVDREHGLNFCIRQIREALQDDAKHPSFIETVRGRGYRFVASAREQRPPSLLRIASVAVAAMLVSALLVWTSVARDDPFPASEQRDPLLQEARYLEEKQTVGDLRRAIVKYQTVASSASPDPRAFSGIARSMNNLAMWGAEPRMESFAAARQAALRAIELDARDSGTLVSLGIATLYLDLDWSSVAPTFEAAVAADPESGEARLWHARVLAATGQPRAALQQAETALALDPESREIMVDMGWFSYFSGDYRAAIVRSQRARVLEENALGAMLCMQMSHIALGEEREARRISEEILAMMSPELELSEDETWIREAAAALEDSCKSRGFVLESARLFAASGQDIKAMELIREGVDQRAWWSPYLGIDPAFSHLRESQSFARLVRPTRSVVQ